MEPEDGFRNVPRKENSSSSDDDEFSPLRKRIKMDNDNDDSTQGDYETSSEQYTQETVLTGASWDEAEASENVAENHDQQSVVSIVTDDNNNHSLTTDQNTHELQTDINDNVSDDTNTDSAMNLESTMQPDTRYVIPQNLLYRPCISDLTMKHNISNSANETDNKHDKPNKAKGISANIEQIRLDFIHSWDDILAADDLLPEADLENLNPTVPENICQYLDDLGATSSTNEALRELIPKVCGEIYNLQRRNEDSNEFQAFEPEPEPEPISISDFLTDPLDLVESNHQHPMTGEEFEFDIDHWNRIQQAFVVPEQIPGFDELFTNNGILIPNSTENDSRDDSTPDNQSDIPNELAHMYNTIISEAARNQHSNAFTPGQSTANRVQSEDHLPNYVKTDSNSSQPNYDADLYRSLLGIPSPFERNYHTPELDHSLNRPAQTERVPTRIFSSLPEVEPTTAGFDMYIAELESTPVDFETNRPELETDPSEMIANPVVMETSPVEVYPTPVAFDINPTGLETNPSGTITNSVDMETNPSLMETIFVELNTTPADSATNPAELVTKPSEMETIPVELYTTPVDSATNPAELVTKPSDMETNSTGFNTNPAELNTSPVELASDPGVFGSNSNLEHSDASTRSGSVAYDGFAQFVIVPAKNDCKPLKIYIPNPSDTGDAPNVQDVPTEESTSDEIADSAQETTNDQEEIAAVDPGNFLAMQEMNHFNMEISTIETEINVIIEEADRFEQQAARFEETAGEFQEVEDFFRQISEIFEFAAMSLQEAVDNFESIPIEAADNVNELDPLSEEIGMEDVPDQQVPDIERNASSDSE